MKHTLHFLLFVFCVMPVFAQSGYPEPPKTPGRLFYIQHNRNHNTYVYDANFIKGNRLHPEEPVDTYRIVYTKGGKKEELSALQRKMAYGVECTRITNTTYEFCLVSFPGKKFYLKANAEGKYTATVNVNNKEIVLEKIFLFANNPDNFFNPDLKYAEFHGKCPRTGKTITERMYP